MWLIGMHGSSMAMHLVSQLPFECTPVICLVIQDPHTHRHTLQCLVVMQPCAWVFARVCVTHFIPKDSTRPVQLHQGLGFSHAHEALQLGHGSIVCAYASSTGSTADPLHKLR